VTIGIAAHGPNAGLAIVKALAAVEAVGRGAIAGFVSFVAITAAGGIHRAVTQRGGSTALFDGDVQSIPAEIAAAETACLMSSGPDRPEPLSQFTSADPRIGLVTGHRMPNTIGVSGVNLNDEVLDLNESRIDARGGRRTRPECGTVAGIVIPPDVEVSRGSPAGKRAHLGSASAERLLTEEPSCEAEDMTAPTISATPKNNP